MRLNGLGRWCDGKENEQLHQCGDALGFDLCHGSVLGCVPRDLLEQSIGVSRGSKGEGQESQRQMSKVKKLKDTCQKSKVKNQNAT